MYGVAHLRRGIRWEYDTSCTGLDHPVHPPLENRSLSNSCPIIPIALNVFRSYCIKLSFKVRGICSRLVTSRPYTCVRIQPRSTSSWTRTRGESLASGPCRPSSSGPSFGSRRASMVRRCAGGCKASLTKDLQRVFKSCNIEKILLRS